MAGRYVTSRAAERLKYCYTARLHQRPTVNHRARRLPHRYPRHAPRKALQRSTRSPQRGPTPRTARLPTGAETLEGFIVAHAETCATPSGPPDGAAPSNTTADLLSTPVDEVTSADRIEFSALWHNNRPAFGSGTASPRSFKFCLAGHRADIRDAQRLPARTAGRRTTQRHHPALPFKKSLIHERGSQAHLQDGATVTLRSNSPPDRPPLSQCTRCATLPQLNEPLLPCGIDCPRGRH